MAFIDENQVSLVEDMRLLMHCYILDKSYGMSDCTTFIAHIILLSVLS